MKRKLLSFAVAFMLLFQTLASAGTIYNLLKGNSGVLGDPADPFYDPAVGIFYWSKFQDYDSTKPDGGAVVAQVTGAVKSTGGSEAYASSTTAKNFDYKVSIDMSNVKTAYNTLHGYAYAAVSSNATLKTAFDNSLVAGTFTVTVTYDPTAITAPSGPYPTSVKYVSNDTTATIYTVGTPDVSTPGAIVIPVTANTTVNALYATPALLDDIYLELGGWTASVQNSVVGATMTGYTMIQDTDTVDYAQIDYQSPQSNVTVWFEESHSHGGGSSSGGGGTTDTDKKQEVVSDEGEQLEADVKDDPNNPGRKRVIPKTSPKEREGFIENGWDRSPYSAPDEDYDPTKPQEIDDVEEPEEGRPVTLYPRYVNKTIPKQLRPDNGEDDEDGVITSGGKDGYLHDAYIVGYPDGEVKPNNKITREEVTAALYRLLNTEYRATIATGEQDFADVEAERWSNDSIATMANGEYVVGYEDGTFGPARPITRAEFATIISKFAGVDAEPAENYFKDIDGHWAKDYILIATNQFWLSGYEDGTFKPDAYITRAEAMTIINRILVRYGDVESDYAIQWPDVDKSDWYYQPVIEATTDHKYERKTNGWSEKWIER